MMPVDDVPLINTLCSLASRAGRPRRFRPASLRPIIVIGAMLTASPAVAQPGGEGALGSDGPQTIVGAAPDDAPAAADALRALDLVESWLAEWAVAPLSDPVPGHAAAVTLRSAGRVVGRAAAHGAGGEGLAIASARAIAQAEEAMAVGRDALSRSRGAEAASLTAVSVQLAGAMVPMRESEIAAPDERLARGLDGIAARLGSRWAVDFPSTYYETARTYRVGMAALGASLVGNPELGALPPEMLAKEHGVAFYRFRTKHVARPVAGAPPVLLWRGGAAPSDQPLDVVGVHALGAGCVQHLARRIESSRSAGASLLFGEYEAVSGRVLEPAASARSQALLLLALERAAGAGEVLSAAGQARAAYDVLAELLWAMPEFREALPREPMTAAWTWHATRHAEGGTPAATLALRAGAALEALRAEARAAEWSGSERDAAYLWGAIEHAADARQPTDELEAALRATIHQAGSGGQVGLLPWAYWADRALAQPSLASAPALRSVRDQLWEYQLTVGDIDPDSADFLGGVVFVGAQARVPGASSARPAAFAAAALRDAELTVESQRFAELLRVLHLLRFLDQLAVGPEEAHMYTDPVLALGAVRSSPWDQRLAPEATAMTLLASIEALESVAALSAAEGE